MHAATAPPSGVRRAASTKALSTLGLAGAVAVVGPRLPFGVPLCPTQSLFHLDCPACGATRGAHDLLRGDLAGALDHNLLLLVALPLAAALWFGWVRTALGRPPWARSAPGWALPLSVVFLAVFTVLRNVPPSGLAWLDAA